MADDLYVNNEAAKGAPAAAPREGFKDLSTEHKLLGCLLKNEDPNRRDWREHQLLASQVKQYWDEGYLSNVPVLTEEQCDRLLEAYETFLDPDNLHPGHGLFYEFHSNQSGDPNNVLLHALGHWRIEPAFHDLCFLPSIAVPASQLICPSREPHPIRLWHDQLFSKPARHGGVVAWHQDYSYWTRTTPMLHITVHIALDDQTTENGGLHFVPGSHRWHRNGGMPLPITDASFRNMESIQNVLTDEEKAAFRPVPSGLKKGQASFHHPLMVHGSYGNHSDGPRRACVVNYIADGVLSDADEPLMNGLPVIPKGKKLAGQFFPLVYSPDPAAVV